MVCVCVGRGSLLYQSSVDFSKEPLHKKFTSEIKKTDVFFRFGVINRGRENSGITQSGKARKQVGVGGKLEIPQS